MSFYQLFDMNSIEQKQIKPCENVLLVSDPRIIDKIISSKFVDIWQKKIIILKILENETFKIDIDTLTVTKLLQIKEESFDFLEIFTNIFRYAFNRKLKIFNYNHLFHLVLQSWMDIPLIISNSFKKQLIVIALNGSIPNDFIDKISEESTNWFANLEGNGNLADMINWLCFLDKTGRLNQIKNDYLENSKINSEETKKFRKIYNITKEEYIIQQQKAKKNGICKFIREGKKCENGTKCKFYHGKVEETYGIQPCRNGFSCIHFLKGDCKFVHEPTENILNRTKIFYNLLEKSDKGYLVKEDDLKIVENEIQSNPFFILKKCKKMGQMYYFIIPQCNASNSKKICNNPVRFVTKRKNQLLNYYCCYEHMISCEPKCSYIVKQNILEKILEK